MSDNPTCPHCGEQNDAPIANDVPAERSSGGEKLFYVIAFIVFVIAVVVFLGHAVFNSREAARRLQCMGHLKQIVLALHNYNQHYGCFPPAFITDEEGKPMHSWRILILPYFCSNDIYEKYRFDEPWDSPNNLAVAKNDFAQYFRCPSNPAVDYLATNYVMIVGPHTISDGPHSRSFKEITDSTANTIMVVEVADSGIRWTEPRDLRFDEIDFRINGERRPGISSHHPNKVNVATCDGAVMSLPDSTPPETVKALTTIEGGEEVKLPEK